MGASANIANGHTLEFILDLLRRDVAEWLIPSSLLANPILTSVSTGLFSIDLLLRCQRQKKKQGLVVPKVAGHQVEYRIMSLDVLSPL